MGLRIDFRSAHHDDLPMRRLRENVGAEVVAAHVGGEDNGAAVASGQLLEVLETDELPVGHHLLLTKASSIGDRPGVVPEHSIRTKEIRDRPGSRFYRPQIAHDVAPSRSPQKKEQRPESDDERLDPDRSVARTETEELSPEHAT